MSWDSIGKAAERGPISLGLMIVVIVVVLGFVVGLAGWGLGLIGETASVAQKEFGPRAALAKYEWFIEQANAIQKMDNDIVMFENRVTAVKEQ